MNERGWIWIILVPLGAIVAIWLALYSFIVLLGGCGDPEGEGLYQLDIAPVVESDPDVETLVQKGNRLGAHCEQAERICDRRVDHLYADCDRRRSRCDARARDSRQAEACWNEWINCGERDIHTWRTCMERIGGRCE